MLLQIAGYVADGAVVILAVAYAVEWKLGRVQLVQSYKDIKLVWRNFAARWRTPKAGS